MSRHNGMTIIELMITIIVLVILASTAAPSMKSLFERKSIFAVGDLFVKSIKLARVEAIQRGRSVQVATESGTGDWSDGWRIEFTNDAGNTEIIRAFPQLPSDPVFNSDIFDGTPTFTILATGQVSVIGDFDLYYRNCTGNNRLTYNVLLSGLMQKGVTACP